MQGKTAIVGNGKLTKAIVLGLLLKGVKAEDIIVVYRNETTSDLHFFLENNIAITSDMQDVAHASYIVLAVSPKGAGNAVLRLRKVDFLHDQTYEIVSFVSGLAVNDIFDSVRSGRYNIICGTLDTNVAYGHGIICAPSYSELFTGMGTYIHETPNQVLSSVTTVGSGKAFDLRSLVFGFEECGKDMSLREWLEGLNVLLEKFNFTKIYRYDEYVIPREFLKIKSQIFRSDLFKYEYKAANRRSLLTMKSTVKALLSLGGHLTVQTLSDEIKTVASPNGSTEKGINKVVTSEQLLSYNFMYKEAFSPVRNKSLDFRPEVLDSIEREMKKEAA